MGPFIQIVYPGALAQGFIHHELALTGGKPQPVHEFIKRHLIEIFCKSEAVAIGLKASDGLLKGLLVGFAQAHDLAHRPHLGSEPVLGPLELFKGPPGKLDHHVISRRRVFFQAPVPPVRDLVHGHTAGQKGRYPGNGKTRGL